MCWRGGHTYRGRLLSFCETGFNSFLSIGSIPPDIHVWYIFCQVFTTSMFMSPLSLGSFPILFCFISISLCFINWLPSKVSKGLEYLHSKSIVHLDLKVSAADEIFLNFKLNISCQDILNFKFNEIIVCSQKTLSWLKEVDRLSRSLTLEQRCSFEKEKR